jgi:hypothetical protein
LLLLSLQVAQQRNITSKCLHKTSLHETKTRLCKINLHKINLHKINLHKINLHKISLENISLDEEAVIVEVAAQEAAVIADVDVAASEVVIIADMDVDVDEDLVPVVAFAVALMEEEEVAVITAQYPTAVSLGPRSKSDIHFSFRVCQSAALTSPTSPKQQPTTGKKFTRTHLMFPPHHGSTAFPSNFPVTTSSCSQLNPLRITWKRRPHLCS